jgi:hypothetical protein
MSVDDASLRYLQFLVLEWCEDGVGSYLRCRPSVHSFSESNLCVWLCVFASLQITRITRNKSVLIPLPHSLFFPLMVSYVSAQAWQYKQLQ